MISRARHRGFAPRASGVGAPPPANLISLLLTTDLLSEGVNLQDAGVVVHLDLPFTNARLQQRLGRIARFGSRHGVVRSFAFRPPASAEAVARIENLLDIKFSVAESARSAPRAMDELRVRMRAWLSAPSDPPVAAAAVVRRPGFLAVVDDGNGLGMISSLDGVISDDPGSLLTALTLASGIECTVSVAIVERCVNDIRAYLRAARSLAPVASARTRRRIQQRISRIVRSARHHDRSRLSALASRASRVVATRSDAYGDTRLAGLAESVLPDDVWLAAVSEHDALERPPDPDVEPQVCAVIVFLAQR